MRVSSVFNKESRLRHLSAWEKRTLRLFSGKRQTTPVFICGLQRSGTTMLMNVFHRHRDTEVYDEHKDSVVFEDYRIRDWRRVDSVVERSRAAAACFKIICDSHLLGRLSARYPLARFIWAYRDYRDVANSTLRKFPHATAAIRKVCRGEAGGGWFQEGVSADTGDVLRQIYTEQLSDFDLTCLVWWARNRIYFEQRGYERANVRLLSYERLVADPETGFTELFAFMGIPHRRRAVADVHAHSVGKNRYPPLATDVAALCEDLMQKLDSVEAKRMPQGQVAGLREASA